MREVELEALREYEKACAHDRAGEEAAALPHYERAIFLGLPHEHRRGALLGMGSTLRNLERLDESVATLKQAVEEFPDDAALPAFLALTLWSRGDTSEAVATLLELVIRHAPIGQYERALAEYVEEVRRAQSSSLLE